MDQVTSDVARAVAGGATNIKAVIDATGLSRLKVERALSALEKQKRLVRDGQGFRPAGVAPLQVRECGSCTACCTLLEVTDAGKGVNEWCQHCVAGKGCSIYEKRPQMCRSFSCAWLQGHLDDDWYPETAGMVVHFSQDAVNVQVDPDHAERWRQEPYFSKLSEWSLNGIRANGRGYAHHRRGRRFGEVPAARADGRSRAHAVRHRVPAGRARIIPATGRPRRGNICSDCMNASPRSNASSRNSAIAPSPRTTTLTRPIAALLELSKIPQAKPPN